MSPYKPVKKKDFDRELKKAGYKLKRSGAGDWILVDDNGNIIKPFVKVTHPGDEVIAEHVNEIRKLIKEAQQEDTP